MERYYWKNQFSKWMVTDGSSVHNLATHYLFKCILIKNHNCSTYSTSDAVFPIGMRSQSSCAILFIWKRNKWDITIIITHWARVIWSVTCVLCVCVCVCGNRLDNLGSTHYTAWIFLFTSASRLALGLTQSPNHGSTSPGTYLPQHSTDHSPPSCAEV